jgi:drug/metabolite transporter (DMT)-like permease
MNFFVQMFVYYIIQKFKQHVAPFVITIRKIFSVVISIFWFSHSIDVMQWFGVGVVFSAAIFDFVSEKYCHRKPTITPIAVENVAFSEIEDTNHNPDSADHV